MGVTPARWLVDTSVLARLSKPVVVGAVGQRIGAGMVGVSILVELELGYTAQDMPGYTDMRTNLVDHLLPVPLSPRAEDRAREVQRRLVETGHHRGVQVPDLLVAALAEVEGLTVLHYDADFDLIAEVTGQSMEWVVPRGSI